jgi:hypothetical protein
MNEQADKMAPSAVSIRVGVESVFARSSFDGTIRVEMTVGGPEGEWWAAVCTRKALSEMAEALRVAAREPSSGTRTVDCGKGYKFSAQPRVATVRYMDPDGNVGMTDKHFVDVSGYEPIGKHPSAVLQFSAEAAEYIGWALLIGMVGA